MDHSDYLKLPLGILLFIIAVGIPIYLLRLFFMATVKAEKVLIVLLLIIWVLFVPWKMPIEDWIGDFVKKYKRSR